MFILIKGPIKVPGILAYHQKKRGLDCSCRGSAAGYQSSLTECLSRKYIILQFSHSSLQIKSMPCLLPHAICLMPSASCHLPHAICLMPSSSCHLPHAICLMSSASCHLYCLIASFLVTPPCISSLSHQLFHVVPCDFITVSKPSLFSTCQESLGSLCYLSY